MGTTAQKLEYLGTTKSQLKDMINYGLPSEQQITSSTTFRNYVSSIFNAFLEALRTPDTLFANLPKITGSGSNITLNDTANAPMRIELAPSELTQDGTPTPSSPQDIHTISGSNKVVVYGKNLFNKNSTIDNKEIQNGIIVNSNGWCVSDYIPIEYNQTYVKNTNEGNSVILYDKNYNVISTNVRFTNNKLTITESNAKYLLVNLPMSIKDTYQLEVGSTATSYEPYMSQKADIDLTGKNIFDGSVGGSAGEYLTNTNAVSTGASTLRYTDYIKLKEGQTSLYISGMQDTMGTPAICFYNSSKTFISGVAYDGSIEKAITIPTNAVYFRTSYRTNNLYFMIEYGTKKTNYEPHLGIEYCKIGNYEDKFIRTSGKNLFDVSKYQNLSTTYEYNLNNYHIKKIQLEPNTDYTISHNASSSSSVVILMNNVQQVNSTGYYDLRNASGSKTFTTDSTGCLYIGVLYTASDTDYNNRINSCYLVINKGETALDYEPYGSNEWYIKKNIGKVVLDGTENWSITSTDTSSVYRKMTTVLAGQTITPSSASQVGLMLCNRYLAKSANDTYLKNVGVSMASSGYLEIYDSDFTTNDISLYKTWLSSNNVILYYVLATPTYTQITGTLAEQLENVYQKLLSYTGTTNISQINNDLGFVMSVSAIEEL